MAPIDTNLFLDGFCAIGKNWSFLGKSSVVTLPRYLKLERWSKLDLKGVRQLKNLNITRIPIGTFNGFSLSTLVTSPVLNVPMNFSVIRSHFISAVDFAISQLNSTITKSNWMGRCCVEYKTWMSKKTCGACIGAQFKIFPVDIEAFGQFFQERFDGLLDFMGYQSFLCLIELGQNAPIKQAFTMLKTLDLKEADEIVLHIARDFFQEEKCLLWNREKVSKVFGKPSDEFYPAFTGGHGNFTFDFTAARRPASDSILSQTIKFYSDAFKEVHRGNPKPFKKPVIISTLADPENSNFKRINMLGWLAAIERSVSEIFEKAKVTARLESIISMTEVSEDFMSEFLDFFDQHYGLDKSRLFTEFNFDQYRDQLNVTLLPAIRTMKEIIQVAESETALSIFSIPSVGKLAI